MDILKIENQKITHMLEKIAIPCYSSLYLCYILCYIFSCLVPTYHFQSSYFSNAELFPSKVSACLE